MRETTRFMLQRFRPSERFDDGSISRVLKYIEGFGNMCSINAFDIR
jgi:hypothetical protein